MAIEFKLRQHDLVKGTCVDIFKDGELCGTIYPNNEDGLKLVSAHLMGDTVEVGFPDGVQMDNGTDPRMPIPAVLIRFDIRPHVYQEGKLRRGKIIHALKSGLALCGFSPSPPRDWPDGHIWAHSSRSDMVNCPQCKEKM